jgi:hypothetical protein
MRIKLLVAIMVAIVAAACGDGSDSPSTSTPTPAPTASSIRLADGAFLTAYGDGAATFPSDQPGLAVGDFNDDGIDDVVAGARFADVSGREDAGAAYVVFGMESLPGEIDFAEGGQDITVIGAAAGDGLGYAAASGDLDGDGTDDLILGAPFASGTGAAYIFFGPLEPGKIDLKSEKAGVTLALSAQPGAFFGDSLDTGDVSADGADDLLIGAPFAANLSGVPGGAALAYFSRSDWTDPAIAPDAVLFGAEQFDEMGDFVIAADLNGDNVDDIVATAEAADGPDNSRATAAEVHVVFGGSDLAGSFLATSGAAGPEPEPAPPIPPPGQPNLSVYGAEENDTLGFALAAADLDGDGDDELAMSARLTTPPRGQADEGIVYILPGGPDLPAVIDLAAPPGDIVMIAGSDPGALFATSLASLPGDQPALVLGGSLVDAEAADDGAVYVLPAGLPATGPVDTLARLTYAGGDAGAHAGANIASGDFNADGRPDLAIIAELAPGPDETRPEAGRLYLVTP